MAMYERRMFLKPTCKTEQNMPSGLSSAIDTGTSFFTVPWNRLGYLKRVQCHGPSGATIEIWDNFGIDPVTTVSGFEKRKDLMIPCVCEMDEGQLIENIDEDIPILGEVILFPSLSGVDCTICARTMGC